MQNIAVRKSPIHGDGLFAVADKNTSEEDPIIFRKGDLIVEYTGRILNSDQMKEITDTTYVFEISKNRNIDASGLENIGRYVNAATRTGRKPNAAFSVNKSTGKVWVKCIRPIRANEEILVYYGRSYWLGRGAFV